MTRVLTYQNSFLCIIFHRSFPLLQQTPFGYNTNHFSSITIFSFANNSIHHKSQPSSSSYLSCFLFGSTMSQSTLFSSGFQLAPFVTSCGLLCRSWEVNTSHPSHASHVGVRLSWKVHKEPDSDLTIIAFEATTPPVSTIQPDLVPSSDLKQKNFHRFNFLCTERTPPLYVNKAALDLFSENHQKLDQLESEVLKTEERGSKSEITSSTRLIVTGKELGGSVAILFTLRLLDSISPGKNRPLCITFGSPLIGDKNLQQAISRSSTWNSCFLQVVSHKDPLPRLFIKNHTSPAAGMSPHAIDYVPFGTFLFCSDANSSCFENPDSILELLKAMASIQDQNQEFQSAVYGDIVENLYKKAICKDLTARGEDMTRYSSLHASIRLQLWALGLPPHTQIWQQQQQKKTDLVAIMGNQEEKFNFQKRTKFDPSRKLNVVKLDMAQLEWYKKDTKNRNIGYYDSYKKMSSRIDQDVVTYHRKLKQYWEKMVEEAETKPQTEGAAFRIRWLYAGTNYRRMVEPLDIADYYRNGHRNYETEGRSRHYKQLEGWLEEDIKKKTKDETKATSGSNSTSTTNVESNSTSKKDVESILTFDSCFWAHVEEALLSCKAVNDAKSRVTQKDEAKRKLLEFEEYVYGLLKKYEVSSEIFLTASSYMTWWNDEYTKIDGAPYHPELARFMSNADNYNVRYVEGTYNFS